MKPTFAGRSRVAQLLEVASLLMALGTISVVGQVPKKAPAQGVKPAELPVYPGASLDVQWSAQMTAGMGGGRDSFFVYLSSDSARQVADFYGTKTGKKVKKLDEGSFALFLEGESAMPDLTIQSNLQGPMAGKTVITILKHKR